MKHKRWQVGNDARTLQRLKDARAYKVQHAASWAATKAIEKRRKAQISRAIKKLRKQLTKGNLAYGLLCTHCSPPRTIRTGSDLNDLPRRVAPEQGFHGGACAECHQEATIIDPTAQTQRPQPQSQLNNPSGQDECESDDPSEQEATIVGMRMAAGVCERFMFWAGYNKDECTWELSENTLDDEHLEARTVLELRSTSGSRRIATITLVPPIGTQYTMQLDGRYTRADPDAGTQVEMDLAD